LLSLTALVEFGKVRQTFTWVKCSSRRRNNLDGGEVSDKSLRPCKDSDPGLGPAFLPWTMGHSVTQPGRQSGQGPAEQSGCPECPTWHPKMGMSRPR
jgi:hypothetical protein